MEAILRNLHWHSDWNGDEVGYDDCLVVGLYGSDELGVDVYIDMDTNTVLEIMPRDEDEI